MAHHDLKIADQTQANSQVNPATEPAPREKYVVEAKGGMFKHGRQYRRGSKVELDAETAQRAIAAGDIKPLSKEPKS